MNLYKIYEETAIECNTTKETIRQTIEEFKERVLNNPSFDYIFAKYKDEYMSTEKFLKIFVYIVMRNISGRN